MIDCEGVGKAKEINHRKAMRFHPSSSHLYNMILIRHRTVVKFFQPPDRAIDNLVCEISSPE